MLFIYCAFYIVRSSTIINSNKVWFYVLLKSKGDVWKLATFLSVKQHQLAQHTTGSTEVIHWCWVITGSINHPNFILLKGKKWAQLETWVLWISRAGVTRPGLHWRRDAPLSGNQSSSKWPVFCQSRYVLAHQFGNQNKICFLLIFLWNWFLVKG